MGSKASLRHEYYRRGERKAFSAPVVRRPDASLNPGVMSREDVMALERMARLEHARAHEIAAGWNRVRLDCDKRLKELQMDAERSESFQKAVEDVWAILGR